MADTAGRRRPLRLGLLGHGWVVEHGYLPALRRSDGPFVVTAVADTVLAGRLRAKAAWPEAAVVADVEALLGSGLDAVLVASPNPDHLPHAMKVLEAGLPCLVEKPMLRDLGDLAMLEAAAGGGLLVPAVACRHRVDTRCWLDGLAELKDLKRLSLSWRRHKGVPFAAWHHRASEGWTGVFADLGAHLVDILGAALDWRFEELKCVGLRRAAGGISDAARWYGGTEMAVVETEVAMDALLEAHGVEIDLAVAWTDAIPGDLVRLEASGSSGSVVLEGLFGFSPERRVPHQRVSRFHRDGSLIRHDQFKAGPALQLAGFESVLDHFAEAIRAGRATDWRPIQFAAVVGTCLAVRGQ